MDLVQASYLFHILKQRIEQNREYLRGSEYRTRILLVDPVLNLLGWEIEDVSKVEIEFRTGQSTQEKADYALKSDDGSTVAVVEAKSLDVDMGWRERRQVKEYADYSNANWCVLTDGSKWMIYDLAQGRNPEEMKPWVEFQVEEQDASALVFKSLALWHANLASGAEPIRANTPVFSPIVNEKPGRGEKGHLSDIPGEDWHKITSKGFMPTGNKPTYIRFGDRSQSVKSWQDFAVQFATWMVEEGKIIRENCPVPLNARGVKYIVNAEPIHADGQDFRGGKKLPDGMWMDTHHSAASLVKHIRNLAIQFGAEPDTIYVKMT